MGPGSSNFTSTVNCLVDLELLKNGKTAKRSGSISLVSFRIDSKNDKFRKVDMREYIAVGYRGLYKSGGGVALSEAGCALYLKNSNIAGSFRRSFRIELANKSYQVKALSVLKRRGSSSGTP